MKIPIVQPTLPSLGEIRSSVEKALRTRQVTRGEFVELFEKEAARFLRVRHAVAVSSCTSGIMLVLKALDLRGEVILPSFTFLATGTSVVWCGLTPVFADVDPHTATLDPAAVERRITPKTAAILAVHTFGCPADCDGLARVAKAHRLPLVFDAAHGFGCEYKGRPVGGFGTAEIFSMSPTKLVVAAEGGLVTTDDDALARRIRVGREYGNPGNYDLEFAGLSARFEAFNAILARWGLKHLPANVAARRRLVTRLRGRLADVPGISFQRIPEGSAGGYKDLSLEIDERAFGASRDRLAEALAAQGVDTRKYYCPLVHETQAMAAYRQGCSERELPNSYRLSRRSLSVPLWSHMPSRVMDRIGSLIRRVHEAGAGKPKRRAR